MRFKTKHKKLSFRRRIFIITVGMIIGIGSLYFTNMMANQLREKERSEVELWSYAMERLGSDFDHSDPLVTRIVNSKNNIPFIVTDDKLSVIQSHLIPDQVVNHPDLMRRRIEELSVANQPLEIQAWDGSLFYIFYGQSLLLTRLVYFPIVQLLVIIAFLVFAYVTFRSSKQDEQNRVWIGLAKETAHQLGTPTSSLLGWIEYLRSQPIDQTVVDEMGHDLTRLMKVVDRFSKIGSETLLKPININEMVGNTVMYFRARMPRNVELRYNGLAIAPVQGMVNEALFEWVVENLLKNALDALQGTGIIDVKIADDNNNIYIDVKDTGKGVAKGNFKRIFDPGFTTKTRGWGLGLSLSRRIIEDYHKGRIGVLESELGKGTTIRITVKKV